MSGLFIIALFLAGARPLESPQLRIEAPPELAAVRTRLESIDPQRFADIAERVGLTDAGPAIDVFLSPESSDLARETSPWIAGFAVGATNLVVLFPARSPSYPNDTLEDVLRHEVAHVLIWRSAAGRPIPRWFNEGFAMSTERAWRFRDQTQLLYQLVLGSRASLDELDRLFAGGQSDQTRAYTLAGAFVQDLLQKHGPAACGEILARIGRGADFDAAFADVVGMSPAGAESQFWQRQRIWTAWVPIVTSSGTLWMVVTILAILAIVMRRRRNLEIEKRWEEEEEDDHRE